MVDSPVITNAIPQIGEQAGPALIPPGTGAGGTSRGRNTELLVGGAVAAAGAVTGAGAFQHSHTTVSDGVPRTLGTPKLTGPHEHTRPRVRSQETR